MNMNASPESVASRYHGQYGVMMLGRSMHGKSGKDCLHINQRILRTNRENSRNPESEVFFRPQIEAPTRKAATRKAHSHDVEKIMVHKACGNFEMLASPSVI
jgi:hypothetical protein